MVPGGSPSYATTDENGHYEAAFTFREVGIQPGEHRVHLVPGDGGGSTTMPVIGPDGQPVAGQTVSRPRFPKEYYQEITKITVDPGSNEQQIDLTTVSAD